MEILLIDMSNQSDDIKAKLNRGEIGQLSDDEAIVKFKREIADFDLQIVSFDDRLMNALYNADSEEIAKIKSEVDKFCQQGLPTLE